MAMHVKALRTLALRDLYEEIESKELFRIIYTGFGQPNTYLCKILGEKLAVKRYETEEFLNLCDEDNPERRFTQFKGEDPFCHTRQAVGQTDGQTAKTSENWRITSGLVDAFDANGRWAVEELVDARTRRRRLLEYADEHDFSMPLLYKLIRRYFQRGMDARAVASAYVNCGAKRTNLLYTDGVGKDGPVQSVPIVKEYTKRPGPAPSEDEYDYAIPGPVLEKLLWMHLDLYTTWQQGVWTLPEEARKLGKRLRQRKRDERGLLKIAPKAAVKGLMPKANYKPVKGRRGRPSQRDLTDSINYHLRRRVEVYDERGRIRRLEFSNHAVVTDRQVQWFWLTTRPNFVRRRRRHPEEEKVRKRSPERGHARQHVKGPGQFYIIDSTVLDVYVVSPVDRKIVLGRPTLYLVVDLYSGMICGMYLGLENPSFEACALALVNVVTPKAEFCKKFGIEISDEDWPARYLPFAFLADRGAEFKSVEPWKSLIEKLRCGISNPPPRTPVARSVGERRFGSVTRGYQKAAFGVVEQDFHTRTGRFYPWDARYTLSEVTTMLLRAIHDYHRNPTEGGQPPPSEMVYLEKTDTPLNRWIYGINSESGMLKSATPDEMRLAVWPHSRARAYAKGILWKKLWYRSESLKDEFWESPEMKGKKKSKSIDIQYDPADLNEIRIVSYGYNEICTLDPSNRHKVADVSLAEWLLLNARDRRNRRKDRLAKQAERYASMQNTQVDDEFAAHEQQEQLKTAGKTHPDASDMRANRRKQRLLDAAAARADKSKPAQTSSVQQPAIDESNAETESGDIATEINDGLLDVLHNS
ncbi:hypothetical protein WN982_40025 [Paraburkholderia sp. IMGN_8]|uniref:hypothetical protein n=1 Tax=Paraburkholderia sp. IMGN_8 TaxID=3136564 RepID=UPI00310164C5